jgi:Rrf2 family protein
MDLTLTKRGDYVVRAAIALARAWGTGNYRKIREVAAEMDLPPSYTGQILHLLAHAGLAVARAGTHGGYRLVCDPREVSLLAVVEAGDGPLQLERCTLRGGPCHREETCALHPAWEGAIAALRHALQSTPLADVAVVDERLRNAHPPVDHDSRSPGSVWRPGARDAGGRRPRSRRVRG